MQHHCSSQHLKEVGKYVVEFLLITWFENYMKILLSHCVTPGHQDFEVNYF